MYSHSERLRYIKTLDLLRLRSIGSLDKIKCAWAISCSTSECEAYVRALTGL